MKAYQNLNITGSINVTGSGITGSLHGTASFAETASYVNILTQDVTMSGSILISGSLLINGLEPGFGNGSSVVISGSAPSGSQSGSMWFNNEDLNLYIQYFDGTSSYWVPSYNNQSLYANSASFASTASYVATASIAKTASLAVTASHALTASSANNFRISGSLTALSGSTFAGTASFTLISAITQDVFVINNKVQIGNAQRPSVNANYSLVMGNNTSVSGAYALAIGNNNFISASSNASFVAGQFNTASAFFQTVVGQYNTTNNTPGAFIVGGGTGTESGSRKNTAVFTTSSITLSGSVFISGSMLLNGAAVGGGGATVTISGSIPSGSANSGSLWWNENDGNLYIQVTGPTGSTYVPATNTVAGGNYGSTLISPNTGSTWNINHNFNTHTPLITVYSGSNVMIPADILSIDANNTRITFSGSVTGTAILATGIGNATTNLATSASIATSASFAQSASLATEAVYSKGRYAYWAPLISTDPSGMGATYTATSAQNQNDNGIRLTSLATAGQTALINWSSPNIDWTRDFRAQVVIYLSNPTPTYIMGDGCVIHMGGTAASQNIYANGADNALKLRIFTFAGATDQTLDPAGAAFFLNTTKGPQGTLGNTFFANNWMRVVIEVCTDKVTSKRMAVAYIDFDGGAGDYATRRTIAAMDITSWVPTGNNFGFFCSTGGARSEQYINSIQFEAL